MERTLIFFLHLFILLNFLACSSLGPTDKEINSYALKAYQKIKSEAKISTNFHWTAILNRVAPRITKASGVKEDWEWMLIENPEANAWCMPGGKIAVYTGLMPLLKNEAALGAILGHEVSHATKKHGKQRYSRAIRGSIIGSVIGAASAVGGQIWCKSESCKMLTGLGGAAAGFAVAFFDRKFSREEETEADKLGQKYMAQAGYDPSEAIKVWDRMSEMNQEKKLLPEFMSTHPSDLTRKENLYKWLPDAFEEYSKAPVRYGTGEEIQ